MDDLISRRAAVEKLTSNLTYMRTFGVDRSIDLIEELPSVEPEIIRCKDCKWYGRADKRRFYRGMDCLQHRIGTIVPDKDFCSRAERRTDG